MKLWKGPHPFHVCFIQENKAWKLAILLCFKENSTAEGFSPLKGMGAVEGHFIFLCLPFSLIKKPLSFSCFLHPFPHYYLPTSLWFHSLNPPDSLSLGKYWAVLATWLVWAQCTVKDSWRLPHFPLYPPLHAIFFYSSVLFHFAIRLYWKNPVIGWIGEVGFSSLESCCKQEPQMNSYGVRVANFYSLLCTLLYNFVTVFCMLEGCVSQRNAF